MISLVDYLKIPSSQDENRESLEEQKVSIKYLKKLEELGGAKTAIKIASQYSLEDLIEGEKILDKFEFQNPPKTVKTKLNQVLQPLLRVNFDFKLVFRQCHMLSTSWFRVFCVSCCISNPKHKVIKSIGNFDKDITVELCNESYSM